MTKLIFERTHAEPCTELADDTMKPATVISNVNDIVTDPSESSDDKRLHNCKRFNLLGIHIYLF